MPQGLQVFRADGSIQLDMSRKFTKVIGTKELSGDGELAFAQYPHNEPWYYVLVKPVSPDKEHLAIIRIDNDQKKIIWKNIVSATILYGVY